MRWAALIALCAVPLVSLTLYGCGAITIAKLIWPERFDLNQQFEALQDAGCSGFCAFNGFGEGFVVGTAPICKASCESDCPGHACISPIPGGSFMPDAGHLCDNVVLTAAKTVFVDDRGDTLEDKFKDVLMQTGDHSKACCCQTRLPMGHTEKKSAPTKPGTYSCDDWCQGGGYGHGVTIGTAPACGASCASDCGGNVCSASNDFFSDHGSPCDLGGDKVCCCAVANDNPLAAEAWKEVKEWNWKPPEKLPSSFSCSDFCESGGWGSGQVIGTAPTCRASCSGDCPNGKCVTASHGQMKDSGHGCATGNKVCCCEKGGNSQTTV